MYSAGHSKAPVAFGTEVWGWAILSQKQAEMIAMQTPTATRNEESRGALGSVWSPEGSITVGT